MNLGIPLPGKQDEEYLNVKKRAAERVNFARCFFFPFHHFMGVGLVEIFVQRKHCLLSEGWLNINWKHDLPLFNKHLQPTPECHKSFLWIWLNLGFWGMISKGPEQIKWAKLGTFESKNWTQMGIKQESFEQLYYVCFSHDTIPLIHETMLLR